MITKISTIIKNHLIQSCHVIYCRTKINIYISISLSKPNLFDRNDDSNPMTIHNFLSISVNRTAAERNKRPFFFATGCVRSCVSIVVFSVILILFRIETGWLVLWRWDYCVVGCFVLFHTWTPSIAEGIKRDHLAGLCKLFCFCNALDFSMSWSWSRCVASGDSGSMIECTLREYGEWNYL